MICKKDKVPHRRTILSRSLSQIRFSRISDELLFFRRVLTSCCRRGRGRGRRQHWDWDSMKGTYCLTQPKFRASTSDLNKRGYHISGRHINLFIIQKKFSDQVNVSENLQLNNICYWSRKTPNIPSVTAGFIFKFIPFSNNLVKDLLARMLMSLITHFI